MIRIEVERAAVEVLKEYWDTNFTEDVERILEEEYYISVTNIINTIEKPDIIDGKVVLRALNSDYVPIAVDPKYFGGVYYVGDNNNLVPIYPRYHTDSDYGHVLDVDVAEYVGIEFEVGTRLQHIMLRDVLKHTSYYDASVEAEFKIPLSPYTKQQIEAIYWFKRFKGFKRDFPVSTHLHVSWWWLYMATAKQYKERVKTPDAPEEYFGRSYNSYCNEGVSRSHYATFHLGVYDVSSDRAEHPAWIDTFEFRLPAAQNLQQLRNSILWIYMAGIDALRDLHLTRDYKYWLQRPEFIIALSRKIRKELLIDDIVLISAVDYYDYLGHIGAEDMYVDEIDVFGKSIYHWINYEVIYRFDGKDAAPRIYYGDIDEEVEKGVYYGEYYYIGIDRKELKYREKRLRRWENDIFSWLGVDMKEVYRIEKELSGKSRIKLLREVA